MDQPEVRLLALLGGWDQRENRPPGKRIITRGLHRLIDQAATEALLQQYALSHADLPPFIKLFLTAPPDSPSS